MSRPVETHEPIAPTAVRYVKLGPGGTWQQTAIEEGRLYFGIESDPHDLAGAGDWAAVRQSYLDQAVPGMVATSNTREIQDFYTLGQDCLWITFARGHLWWGFAQETVHALPAWQSDGRRYYRAMIGEWQCADRIGQLLLIDRLSSRLTQLAGYRRTICAVKEEAYLLRILNAEPDPLTAQVQQCQQALVEAVSALIAQLHWSDFELFVDLLLARGGWQRISQLGGLQADIDLLVELPATGERLAVQVKSILDQAMASRCCSAMRESGIADRFLIASHSPGKAVTLDGGVELWDGQALASRAVSAGLTSWLLDHSR